MSSKATNLGKWSKGKKTSASKRSPRRKGVGAGPPGSVNADAVPKKK